MAGLALSGGSLLSVLQGKRVYQPIWQIIAVQNSNPGNSSNQLLVSDGINLSYNIALHPNCHITFDKSQWKSQNNGKSAEEVISNQKYPVLKVVDYLLKKGDETSVVFLSKVRLMGWEKGTKVPKILEQTEVPVIAGDCEIVMKSREGLEQFDVPGIQICDESEQVETLKNEVCSDYNSVINKKPISLMDAVGARSIKEKTSKINQEDLITGNLAPLGPLGLNIFTLCDKCSSITYVTNNKISQFKPPARVLLENLSDILPNKIKYEFCCCDDENEQFRKEFQNKCMVVNQDTSSGSDRKVQCILVSKDQNCKDHEDDDEAKLKLSNGDSSDCEDKLKLTNGTQSDSSESTDDGLAKCLVPISKKTVRVSNKLRLCEYCGVLERDMSACKHCAKVWYCSAACKKSDVKAHTSVCRAYITTRRYLDEKAEFARKIDEPDDGCGTCGFWRESLEACSKCNKVLYCSYRCKDKASEKHKPVCEAFAVIQNYRKKYIQARKQEVD